MLSPLQIPVAVRSKAWVCGRSLIGIVGSNPTLCMNVCLLWVLCIVRWRSLRRADHPSRGVLPSVACLSVIVKPRQWGGPGLLEAVAPWRNAPLWQRDWRHPSCFCFPCSILASHLYALWHFRRAFSYLNAFQPAELNPDNGVCDQEQWDTKRVAVRWKALQCPRMEL